MIPPEEFLTAYGAYPPRSSSPRGRLLSIPIHQILVRSVAVGAAVDIHHPLVLTREGGGANPLPLCERGAAEGAGRQGSGFSGISPNPSGLTGASQCQIEEGKNDTEQQENHEDENGGFPPFLIDVPIVG